MNEHGQAAQSLCAFPEGLGQQGRLPRVIDQIVHQRDSPERPFPRRKRLKRAGHAQRSGVDQKVRSHIMALLPGYDPGMERLRQTSRPFFRACGQDNIPALPAQAVHHGSGRSTRAEHQRPLQPDVELRQWSHEPGDIRIFPPERVLFPEQRVHGSGFPGVVRQVVHQVHDRLLVRDGHAQAVNGQGAQGRHECRQPVRRRVPGMIGRPDAGFSGGPVVQDRAQGMRKRMTDNTEKQHGELAGLGIAGESPVCLFGRLRTHPRVKGSAVFFSSVASKNNPEFIRAIQVESLHP